jgi:metal-dependent amidase/aminoacylase/carboxypeptidase family protein
MRRSDRTASWIARLPAAMVLAGAAVIAGAAGAAAPTPATLDALIDRETPSLLALYKSLHAAGFNVAERVGRYERPGLIGYGVVGVLKNGAGPTVLVRTELDALPVEEKTGLPYASAARAANESGQDVGVGQACGHDIHMTSFIGSARALEKGLGARNVVKSDPVMGSEDFGRFALEGHAIPAVQLSLGAVDPAMADAARRSGVKMPSLRPGLFAPLPEPAIRTGVKATTLAVLELMGK